MRTSLIAGAAICSILTASLAGAGAAAAQEAAAGQGVAGQGVAGQGVAAQGVAAPLIPRIKLFGNPSRIAGKLSPDGKWLAWIAPRGGVLNIWVAPVSDPSHGRPQNSIAFNAAAEQFLGHCLGGRSEPIGEALKASTATVPHGAEYTPGLATAVAAK